ncbi:hypothetical protein AVEN_110453-1, partial [Araneus ventricosus]
MKSDLNPNHIRIRKYALEVGKASSMEPWWPSGKVWSPGPESSRLATRFHRRTAV